MHTYLAIVSTMSSISRQSAAYLRYRVLDELLRDTKHEYNIQDLVKECNARIKNSTRIQEPRADTNHHVVW